MDTKRKKIPKGTEMTPAVLFGILFSVAAGLLIEAFFQLIKYKEAANTDRPRVIKEYFNPTHYMSVTQFIASGNRKWIRYFAFRFAPPLIIFILLAAILQKYFDAENVAPLIVVGCVASLLLRDFVRLFSKKAMISERMVHAFNICALLVIASGVGVAANTVDISFLAPSPEGLIDNLWAALFTAMLVAVYLRASNTTKQGDDSAKEIDLSNAVLRSYGKLNELYYHAIIHMCNVNNTSVPLLYAILIYEDMNRPAWLRRVENLIVKVTKKELTVGIAQVKSKVSLTDIESMNKAAEILKDTKNLNEEFQQSIYNSHQLQAILERYNSGSQYKHAIVTVLSNLHDYASEVFIEAEDILTNSDDEEEKK